jgi:hypothetical protein
MKAFVKVGESLLLVSCSSTSLSYRGCTWGSRILTLQTSACLEEEGVVITQLLFIFHWNIEYRVFQFSVVRRGE